MKCEDCGGPVYDNTDPADKKSPNSPDYKCKDPDCGWAKWLTPKGDPRRRAAAKKPAKMAGAVAGNDRETYWADKAAADKAAIPVMRRSHAQEMALRFFLAVGIAPKELDALTSVIDWFEKDATASLKKRYGQEKDARLNVKSPEQQQPLAELAEDVESTGDDDEELDL